MKSLEISFYKNIATVSYQIELDAWKQRLHPNEEKLKDEATTISKAVRYLKGFKSFRIGFGQEDWYESCNSYDVPYILCTDENRKVKIEYYDYNDIPKQWNKCYTLKLEDVSDVRGFNKFINALDINLEKKVLNQFRKAIKEQSSFEIEL